VTFRDAMPFQRDARGDRGGRLPLAGRMRRLLAVAITLLLAQACTYSSVYAPHPSPAQIGESVAYTVGTRCGLDSMAFDIDGSLWVPVSIEAADREGTPAGFARDDDVGTLTLVSDEAAEYRSSGGRVIQLRRLAGNFEAQDC
jgi:hypothetical protein